MFISPAGCSVLVISPRIERRYTCPGAIFFCYYAVTLNDTAMAFLELCDGQRSTADIIHEMSEQYAVGHDELVEDLKSFVKELIGAGIIHSVTASK